MWKDWRVVGKSTALVFSQRNIYTPYSEEKHKFKEVWYDIIEMVFIHDYSIRIRMDRDDTISNRYGNTKIYIWRINQEIGHTLYFFAKTQ